MKLSNVSMILAVALGSTFQVGSAQGNNGNGNGNNGNGNGNAWGQKYPEALADCLDQFNPGICRKMANIAERIEQDGNFDMDEFLSMKQLMKEARPANPNKVNFKDVALDVLNRNKGKDKDQKELLLEIAGELDSEEMQHKLITDIERGYSGLEDGVPVDPYAGQWEVQPPELGGGRRRLGVPVQGGGFGDPWPNKIIKYYVVAEYDLSGWNTYTTKILPAMDEVEQLTNLKFQYEGWVWTESSATVHGAVYVKVNDPHGCWAYIGYWPNYATKMNIGANCEAKGIIQHELLHVAGMEHQHIACYRDNYITVNSGNIQSGESQWFEKLECNQHGYEAVYDYGSIMHYGEDAFSINPPDWKTIDCGSNGGDCGQTTGLSTYDIWELNLLYTNYYPYNSGL